MPLRDAAPSPPLTLLDSLHRLAKEHRADHSISFLDTLFIKTGSEGIDSTLRRSRILFAGFVARMEDARLPKYAMCGEVGQLWGAWTV